MYEHIEVEILESIATVTLNRPDKLNAYTVYMGEEIVDAFDTLRDNDDAKVVIITGAGRGFCAGVDLEHLKEQAEGAGTDDAPRLGEERMVREFPLTLANYPKPVIAAINGHAIGIGITMLLACDIRIAAEEAKLGLPFARMGILPGLGSTYLLPRLVGPAKARELVLTARNVLAPEAAEIGLVNETMPAVKLLPRAREMAQAMIACQPAALAASRQLLSAGEARELSAAMRREQEASSALRQ